MKSKAHQEDIFRGGTDVLGLKMWSVCTLNGRGVSLSLQNEHKAWMGTEWERSVFELKNTTRHRGEKVLRRSGLASDQLSTNFKSPERFHI